MQIDKPTQSGAALVVPAGTTVVAGATVVLLLATGFAELEPDVLGPEAWCEPQAVTATPSAIAARGNKLRSIVLGLLLAKRRQLLTNTELTLDALAWQEARRYTVA
ncbi:hypothetical protein MSTO_60870 [Mycobacterium stomatepiae]|uniref:Uncharacterized protein n=1 Tax=Mycobacterium stomatepiae TaxID=470076 RepID=A0A7I7QI11_9MYCO|nr:hypothetical protein [Mycobacterium stomatepiae]BBY19807.1 hypothetical protein MSTO_00120 [Mycobacterium stomatepiae]BBY25882.1 hypothetical protein MSTO_60870 [Mycobacterium stomatepiae]